MAVAVHLRWPPHSGFLLAWGRHATGWWGCVAMRVRLETAEDAGELDVAAWLPAGVLTKPGWSGEQVVSRVVLPEDQRVWPAPPRWPSWYAGVWSDGQLRLPPGAVMATGAAWRPRPPRGARPTSPGLGAAE